MFPKYSSCYIINTFVNILLFIIWPFGGFFYNLLRPVSRLTYVFFVFFFFLAANADSDIRGYDDPVLCALQHCRQRSGIPLCAENLSA